MLKRIQADSRRRRASDATYSGMYSHSARRKSIQSHKSFKSAQSLESSDTDEEFVELMRAAKLRKDTNQLVVRKPEYIPDGFAPSPSTNINDDDGSISFFPGFVLGILFLN